MVWCGFGDCATVSKTLDLGHHWMIPQVMEGWSQKSLPVPSAGAEWQLPPSQGMRRLTGALQAAEQLHREKLRRTGKKEPLGPLGMQLAGPWDNGCMMLSKRLENQSIGITHNILN